MDRLGKRRAVLVGLLCHLLSYLFLIRLAGTLVGALTGVFFIFLTFEFSVVAIIPLISELVPEARGTVLALNLAVMAFGRVIGSLLAPRLWASSGFVVNAWSRRVLCVAILVWWLGVREQPGSAPISPPDTQ